MKRLLYGIVMLCFMDLFIQLPIMGPFAKSLGAGSFVIGLAVGLYSLTNMFGNIAAGYWIDRFGARTILLLGFFLTAGVMLLYPLVSLPWQLIAVRFVHGLTGGLLVPSAFTLISHFASARQPGRAMALSGAAVGAAAIVGPAAAGITKAQLGLHPLFIGTAVLLALGGLLVWAAVPASGARQITRRLQPEPSQPLAGFEVILRKKPVMQSYVGACTDIGLHHRLLAKNDFKPCQRLRWLRLKTTGDLPCSRCWHSRPDKQTAKREQNRCSNK